MSVSERLKKILDAHVPSTVKFTSRIGSEGQLLMESRIITHMHVKPITEDLELFEALKETINESWNSGTGCYVITNDIDNLFWGIKHHISSTYDDICIRSPATKRKTMSFIHEVDVDDKHLANFLVQMFIDMKKSSFNLKNLAEQRTYLESLEILRRTYGKRS